MRDGIGHQGAERGQNGDADRRQPSPSPVKIYPMVFEFSGGCFSSAKCRRAPGGEIEVERGQMGEGRGFQRGSQGFILIDGFGLWCTGDGHHWLPWAAVRGSMVC
jgi:hypothetical protein